MRRDPRRTLRATVLIVWTAFLAWLLVTGEVDRYIGPRTLWVVVFGAVALGVTALGYLVTLRSPAGERPSAGELLGLSTMLLPILAIVLVPAPILGSLAASQKLGGASVALGTIEPRPLGPGDEISFPEIEYASESEEYAATIGLADGYPIELTGFVTRPDGLVGGEFALTRFSIFCCAADVVPHSVPVDPGTSEISYEEDRWLTIEGELRELEGGFVLVAERITPTEEPDDPYLR